jgi:glycosyltransferase involved in cell wall biosynthesis
MEICFVERRDRETSSIERVFKVVSDLISRSGLKTRFAKLRFGNSLSGTLGNLLFPDVPKADLYHIAGHVHYIALRLPAKRTVVTVHDVGILNNRSGIRRWVIKKLYFQWPLARVHRVTAISDATKDDLVRVAGCEPEKIVVIPNPVTIVPVDRRRTFNVDHPTVLQMGTAPHKNLANVIAALEGFKCKLRVVGPLTDDDRERLKKAEIDFENVHGLSGDEVIEEYLKADVLVFCSTFEGFGLPTVEAQACSLPVITSDVRPMRDVAGQGALLTDPTDPIRIRSALERIRTDRELRERLVADGLRNIERFTPQRIAAQYEKLYRTMAQEIAVGGEV